MGRRIVDHSGEVYNGWELVRRAWEMDSVHAYYVCRCQVCGKTRRAVIRDVKSYVPCTHGRQSPRSAQSAPGNFLYLGVTADRYELPVAVADTIEEIAAMTGYPVSRIKYAVTPSGMARYGNTRATSGIRFYRIPLEVVENGESG